MRLGIFIQKIVAPHIIFSFFLKILVGGGGNHNVIKLLVSHAAVFVSFSCNTPP